MEVEIQLCHLRAFRGQHSECISTRREDQGNSGASDQQRNNNGLNPNTGTIHPDRTVSSLSSSGSSANSAQFYRLSRISLPSFSGDILQ